MNANLRIGTGTRTGTTLRAVASVFATTLVAITLIATIPACRRENAAPAASDGAGGALTSAQPPIEAAAALPDAARVVTDIFRDASDGDRDGRFDLKDGGGAKFWFGQDFTLGRQRYYVGLAYSDPTAGAQPQDEADAADAGVTIAQATYVLDGAQWRKLTTAADIGRFGMNAQPPVLAQDETAQGYAGTSGRYLLAVPAWHSEMGGVEMRSAEVFAFDAGTSTWKYAGSLYTGENDAAGCEQGKTVSGAECTASTGALRFAAAAQGGWPEITVIRSGTVIGSDGKARALGSADAIRYAYSDSAGTYVESQTQTSQQ